MAACGACQRRHGLTACIVCSLARVVWQDDLETGRSDGPCTTYGGSPCLASGAAFAVDEIEVWAVEEDPPPPSEEEQAVAAGENALTAAGVLSSKHTETRNF